MNKRQKKKFFKKNIEEVKKLNLSKEQKTERRLSI